MTKYIIRAALRDETNEGWVWMAGSGYRSRTIVRITVPDGTRKAFCQVRQIDENFLDHYNQSDKEKSRLVREGKKHRIDIDPKTPTIVMSEWYRDALGGFSTTTKKNGWKEIELEFQPYDHGLKHLLGQLLAASQHPDISVRLGTRLGVLGTWLGLMGILPTFWELVGLNTCLRPITTLLIGAVTAAFGIWISWTPPPPPLKSNAK